MREARLIPTARLGQKRRGGSLLSLSPVRWKTDAKWALEPSIASEPLGGISRKVIAERGAVKRSKRWSWQIKCKYSGYVKLLAPHADLASDGFIVLHCTKGKKIGNATINKHPPWLDVMIVIQYSSRIDAR
jgi:hypothetical protein